MLVEVQRTFFLEVDRVTDGRLTGGFAELNGSFDCHVEGIDGRRHAKAVILISVVREGLAFTELDRPVGQVGLELGLIEIIKAFGRTGVILSGVCILGANTIDLCNTVSNGGLGHGQTDITILGTVETVDLCSTSGTPGVMIIGLDFVTTVSGVEGIFKIDVGVSTDEHLHVILGGFLAFGDKEFGIEGEFIGEGKVGVMLEEGLECVRSLKTNHFFTGIERGLEIDGFQPFFAESGLDNSCFGAGTLNNDISIKHVTFLVKNNESWLLALEQGDSETFLSFILDIFSVWGVDLENTCGHLEFEGDLSSGDLKCAAPRTGGVLNQVSS